MRYFVWAEYYYASLSKKVSSHELLFHQGHHHGVSPTRADIAAVTADLRARVEELGVSRRQPLPIPPADFDSSVKIKTRSSSGEEDAS